MAMVRTLKKEKKLMVLIQINANKKTMFPFQNVHLKNTMS